MKDARASAPPWGPTLSCRIAVVRAANSPSQSARSRREAYFRKNSPIPTGPDFPQVDSLLVIHDIVFRDVGGGFLRFRQRTDPLIIIGLLRGWVLVLLQEHELRVEEESKLFWQITNCPADLEDVKTSKPTPPLPSTSEGQSLSVRHRENSTQHVEC